MKEDFFAFVAGFKKMTGMDLSGYNQAQVVRRLEPLLEQYTHGSYLALLHAMEEEESIVREAMRRLTIHYSGFFRDERFWQALKPLVHQLAQRYGYLQTWSAGCGNGEEAWTLAFFLSRLLPRGNFKILASDIDQDALNIAAAGLYPRVKGIPSQDLSLYFSASDQGYSILEQYRKYVHFRKHDLIKDIYPTNMQLILCRNVMIYFRQTVKEATGEKMGKSLTEGGLLCLGGSEYLSVHGFSKTISDYNIYVK